MREAAGVHLWRAGDHRGAEGGYTVAWEELGGGGNAVGEGQPGVVGGEVDAVAAVDLPVDVAWDDVRVVLLAIGVSAAKVARDDDVLWAAERRGGMLREKMECGVRRLTC